jgi:DNA-binding MarR family transcriptional regulator
LSVCHPKAELTTPKRLGRGKRDMLGNSTRALDSGQSSRYNLIMKRDVAKPELLERIASDCIAVRVRLINRVVTAIYDEALRPFGFRVSQGNILVAVARIGEARPGDICRLLRLEKSTLSRDVEVMKEKGWLESDPPAGGRNQVIRVTTAGLDLLARSRPAWESAQSEARLLIGDAGVDSIKQIATKLGPWTADA